MAERASAKTKKKKGRKKNARVYEDKKRKTTHKH